MSHLARVLTVVAATLGLLVTAVPPAMATPVCTDGFMGGPPRSACGGRVFAEVENSTDYVQYLPDPATGFSEYQHGLEYLEQLYPRWVSVFTLSEYTGDEDAVTAGPDGIRPYAPDDTGDGYEILVVKVTDHQVADEGKQNLVFSLSVHGDERGGLEGGVRAVEDLAVAAEEGGEIVDGIDNYESTTGSAPEFHAYEVADVLAEEAVYFIDFNIDGWATGERNNVDGTPLYQRGNHMGTDLNRQMPTVGRIDSSRNPLQESEMRHGLDLMEDLAAAGPGGELAYGADVHGEGTSNAYVDIMYPGGQFDSVDHRRLMAIAERTKSVIDETLFDGTIDDVEASTGGNSSSPDDPVGGNVPTKPAHWATVWDTLGYTDTGFIGDYLAAELGVTGMDYEIFLNHSDFRAYGRPWSVVLQENYVNATRAIIKTAMAYALTQEQEFSAETVAVDPVGRAGYVFNPDTVTDGDGNGPGRLPGPEGDGVGADGQPVEQRSYSATNMRWFADTNRLMPEPFVPFTPAAIAADPEALDAVDTLVLADVALPGVRTSSGEVGPVSAAEAADYYAHIRDWVERGGNLVLTDRALHALGDLDVLDSGAVSDVEVYLPYTDIQDLSHAMVEGLRPNARQLVETPILGYGIDDEEVGAQMTVVDEAAFTDAGGEVVGTTGDGLVSVGELAVGEGQVRLVGGALPTPTEANDHRYGLKDYAMSYTALFIMENSIVHDVADLGVAPPPPAPDTDLPDGGEEPSGDGDSSEGSEPGPVDPGDPVEADTVGRVAGATRVDTALEVSRQAFDDGEAGGVVLARADAFPDALAGTPLAVDRNAPLLLTGTDALDSGVSAELQRVLPAGGTVTLLGGTAALSADVEEQVADLGYDTVRFAGSNRFETAAAIAADGLGSPDTLMVASGADFPDAVAAGAAAGHVDAAVILSDGERMPAETRAYLDGHSEAERFAVGGPAARADRDATPLVGESRFETAIAVAEKFFADPEAVGLATGQQFADALSGGVLMAGLGGPLLLSAPDALPATVGDYLRANADGINRALVFGGDAALSDDVRADVEAAIAASD